MRVMKKFLFWLTLALLSVNAVVAHDGPVAVQQKVQKTFSPEQIARAKGNLVCLESLNAGFVMDIRYATTNNFTGVILYPVARAYLNRDAAAALVKAQGDLRKKGLGLKIFDGYRPLRVQQKMWDLIQDDRYVSNPATNAGRHTRGTAVDVTLVNLKTGKELPMPSAFDDFSEKAHIDYAGATPEEKRNSKLLRQTMVRHGFIAFPYEWWHFDYRGWENHPPLDVGLEELRHE